MTDLITPDEVKTILRHAVPASVVRLCQDYLTLWKKNFELEKDLHKAMIEWEKALKASRPPLETKHGENLVVIAEEASSKFCPCGCDRPVP